MSDQALAVWGLELATNFSRSGPTAPPDTRGKNVWPYSLMTSKEFCIWTIMSAQIFATASSSTVPGLPIHVIEVFGFFSFFNLDTSYVVHEECLSSPFLLAWLILGGGLLLVLVQVGSFTLAALMHHNKDEMASRASALLEKTCQFVNRPCFVLMSAVYPLVTKRCFSLLHCSKCDELACKEFGADSTVLLRGPTIARILNINNRQTEGNGTRADLKMPCWRGDHTLAYEPLTYNTFVVMIQVHSFLMCGRCACSPACRAT